MSQLPAKVEHVVLEAQIIDPPRAAADMTDAEIGAEASACIDRSLASRADSVEQAIRAGELLRVAKDRCRAQGASWRDWCARHWKKSRKTADTYIAVALEVSPETLGGRAPRVSQALTLPSVRALLTDAGIGAGGTREIDEVREPGADEDEDAPGADGLTATERARVNAIKAAEEKAHADKVAARLARRNEWRAKKEAEERQKKEQETAEQRMARLAQAAADRARHEADLRAIEDAKNRPAGPETPKPRPVAPAETLSAGPTCDAMEQIVLSAQRRWADLRMEPAPMVERFGRMVMHPRDEFAAYVAEWVNAGPEIVRHLQSMKAEDVKVVRAIKRAASVSA